jgi:hypothetical protein
MITNSNPSIVTQSYDNKYIYIYICKCLSILYFRSRFSCSRVAKQQYNVSIETHVTKATETLAPSYIRLLYVDLENQKMHLNYGKDT